MKLRVISAVIERRFFFFSFLLLLFSFLHSSSSLFLIFWNDEGWWQRWFWSQWFPLITLFPSAFLIFTLPKLLSVFPSLPLPFHSFSPAFIGQRPCAGNSQLDNVCRGMTAVTYAP
jgi:hypothetical protein